MGGGMVACESVNGAENMIDPAPVLAIVSCVVDIMFATSFF